MDNFILKITKFLPLCFMLACGSLTLSPAKFPHQQIAQSNQLVDAYQAPFELSIEAPEKLGHQYGLVIFPISSVHSTNLEADLEQALLEAQVLYGSMKVQPRKSYRSKPKVNLTSVNLSVYDYFFYRKTYCEISGSVEIPDLNFTSGPVQVDHHWWSAFGFRKELEFTYLACLRKFAQKTLEIVK